MPSSSMPPAIGCCFDHPHTDNLSRSGNMPRSSRRGPRRSRHIFLPLSGAFSGFRYLPSDMALSAANAFEKFDGDRRVDSPANAHELAGAGADQAAYPGKGAVLADDVDGFRIPAHPDQCHIGRDVESGRAGHLAGGRRQFDACRRLSSCGFRCGSKNFAVLTAARAGSWPVSIPATSASAVSTFRPPEQAIAGDGPVAGPTPGNVVEQLQDVFCNAGGCGGAAVDRRQCVCFNSATVRVTGQVFAGMDSSHP